MLQLKEKCHGMMQDAAAKPWNAVTNATARRAMQSPMPRHNTCQVPQHKKTRDLKRNTAA